MITAKLAPRRVPEVDGYQPPLYPAEILTGRIISQNSDTGYILQSLSPSVPFQFLFSITMASIHERWTQQRGHRPVRIANCSGYKTDPGYKMLEQASLGDVDFITGDYLAEVNIAENAEAMAVGEHPGYEFTAWNGIQQSIDVLNEKGIKVIVNGGAQNPKGLAERVCGLVKDKGYGLKVAWIEGDNLLEEAREMVKNGELPPHLDSENTGVHLAKGVTRSPDSQKKPIVSANAYLGAREIVKALELGADIVIAGRVADASPVSITDIRRHELI